LSTSSSALSLSPPRTDVSYASSATSMDFTSPGDNISTEWNGDSFSFCGKQTWPTGISSEVITQHTLKLQSQARLAQTLPKEKLQNPRRTNRLVEEKNTGGSSSGNETITCPLPPPSLVRQADRKVNFVDNLVDTAAQIVEAIWPASTICKGTEPSFGRILPLRTFIQETLRRSRSSYSTLQVALYYLFVIRPFVPLDENNLVQDKFYDVRVLQCGRRMFLAALILASKYLQDRNYSARAWSKISGLNISEINANEMAFLSAVNWRLHISDCIFEKWTKVVLKCTPTTSILSASGSNGYSINKWSIILAKLDMSLDVSVVDDLLSSIPEQPCQTSKLALACVLQYNVGNACATIHADSMKTNASSRQIAESGSKTTSMAFALNAPSLGKSSVNENVHKVIQLCEGRNTPRTMRKSSLSMCENIEKNGCAVAYEESCPSLLGGRRSKSQLYDNSLNMKSCAVNQRDDPGRTPLREEVLGKPSDSRPESRRLPSAPCTLTIPESSRQTRKRGIETPVTARHQKKQKEKTSEYPMQKPTAVVPSGLTPQMRQMNASFSLSSKKGNGLRMTLTPGLSAPGNHGPPMRPGAGARSMTNVYG